MTETYTDHVDIEVHDILVDTCTEHLNNVRHSHSSYHHIALSHTHTHTHDT